MSTFSGEFQTSRCNVVGYIYFYKDQALAGAIMNGSLKIVESILRTNHFDPSKKDSKGNSALSYAESKGKRKLASVLRKYGAK